MGRAVVWISELSQRTGFPIDTVKHYLRVGVLPRGEPLGPHRMEYDETHVERLLLVKALTEVGGLSLDRIRRIFASADESRDTLRDVIGLAHLELSADLVERHDPSPASLAVVDRLIEHQGWEVETAGNHRAALAVAIDTLVLVRSDGIRDSPVFEQLLNDYAEHLSAVALTEFAQVDTSSRHATINTVLIGSVLNEPLILLIRRMAQQNAARAWWAADIWPGESEPEEISAR